MPANEVTAADPRRLVIANALNHPRLMDWTADSAHMRGIYGFNSIDPRSRSFNLIRGRLLDLRRQHKIRMIGIVSATPSVGKSFVSANISASLSRDPKVQAVAVDLDLRRGSLSRQFGIETENGLSDFLSSGNPPEAVRLDGEALSVIPTRGGMMHSAELLASERAKMFFEGLNSSDERNLFVCDLPPVFANDDAVITMASVDKYILVAEEGRTTEREVRDAVHALGKERLLGVILNKFRGGVISEGYGFDSYYAGQYDGKPDGTL